MSDLWPITSRVLGVFLVMVAGAVGRRLHWLTSESDKSLASLTANVLLPALFFERIVQSDQFDSLAESWAPPVVGFVTTCLGFLLAGVVAWKIGPWIGLREPSSQRTFAFCVGIGNYGYIPLPLAEHFYPNAVVTLMVHNVGVDLALWSVGVAIISGQFGGHWKRALLSPPLLAVVAAIGIRQVGMADRLPGPLIQLAESLGQCAIPLGLILSGAIILDYVRLVHWRKNISTIIAAVTLRQVLLPMGMLAFAFFASVDIELQQVLLLQAAMPTATFPIVLVLLYGQDTGTALRAALGTGVLGVVTIPAWLAAGKWLLGL